MAIEGLQFLQATSPNYNKYNVQRSNQQNYYQMPSTTAQVNPSYKPSVEDFERAQQYIDGNLFASKVGQAQAPKSSQNVKGAAFDGFSVPQNNGTGELIADVSNRADSIDGCAWEPYVA